VAQVAVRTTPALPVVEQLTKVSLEVLLIKITMVLAVAVLTRLVKTLLFPLLVVTVGQVFLRQLLALVSLGLAVEVVTVHQSVAPAVLVEAATAVL
jgi:hypothetical protein